MIYKKDDNISGNNAHRDGYPPQVNAQHHSSPPSPHFIQQRQPPPHQQRQPQQQQLHHTPHRQNNGCGKIVFIGLLLLAILAASLFLLFQKKPDNLPSNSNSVSDSLPTAAANNENVKEITVVPCSKNPTVKHICMENANEFLGNSWNKCLKETSDCNYKGAFQTENIFWYGVTGTGKNEYIDTFKFDLQNLTVQKFERTAFNNSINDIFTALNYDKFVFGKMEQAKIYTNSSKTLTDFKYIEKSATPNFIFSYLIDDGNNGILIGIDNNLFAIKNGKRIDLTDNSDFLSLSLSHDKKILRWYATEQDFITNNLYSFNLETEQVSKIPCSLFGGGAFLDNKYITPPSKKMLDLNTNEILDMSSIFNDTRIPSQENNSWEFLNDEYAFIYGYTSPSYALKLNLDNKKITDVVQVGNGEEQFITCEYINDIMHIATLQNCDCQKNIVISLQTPFEY